MINDERSVDYFKYIASQQYLSMVIEDYGDEHVEKLVSLTDTISRIYKYLNYQLFDYVFIYVVISGEDDILSMFDTVSNTITSYENLSAFNSSNLVIEIKSSGELLVCQDLAFLPNKVTDKVILYEYNGRSKREKIYAKNKHKVLKEIPGSDSYFAIQSYKDLESALEDYKAKFARFSTCPYLENVWYDNNKIFFKSKPEHILRDSLTYYLKVRLRNAEVRPEQVVDRSHPVDIKITWSLTNKLALLEIKWLGKSLDKSKKSFKQIYTRVRALSGADQLAFYLDENKKQSPEKYTVGYLIVYDCRRYHCNSSTKDVALKNGLHYQNDDIRYDPEYDKIRKDFAKPVRFFLEPKYN